MHPKPTGPWHGKALHLWTTSCDVRSNEAKSVVATVEAHAAPRPSVGLACATLTKDGAIASPDRSAIVPRLHALGVETSIVVANTGESGFDGALAARVLHDEAARTRTIDALLDAQSRETHAAIEIDLEALPTSARDDLTAFVRTLRQRAPKTVRIEVDVHPKTMDDPGWDGPGAHDYAALANAGAIVRLMTYDLSIGPVPPGPSTNARWIHAVVDYARGKGVSPDALEMGLPAYGYDFPPQGKGAPIAMRHEDVMRLALRTNAQLIRDANDVLHFTYDAPDGKHEVWLDDAKSLGRVMIDAASIAPEVRGVAIWGIGSADPRLLPALADLGL